MLKPLIVLVSAELPDVLFVQMRLVKPLQIPEKTSNTASVIVVGVTVIVWLVLVATNVYQTSSSAVPLQPASDCVALTVVPFDELVHVVVGFTVNELALLQKSFAGGLVIQKLDNPILMLLPTLTTFTQYVPFGSETYIFSVCALFELMLFAQSI